MKLMLYLILFLLRESFILSEIRRKVNRSANKTQTCGKSAYVSGEKILFGRYARNGEFPWQISIISFNTNGVDFCGGSIIDQKTILTAAHCVQGKGTVSVVRYNSLYPSSGGTAITDCRIIINPNFNNQTLENDIAIVKLTKPLVLGLINSGTVCLPTKNSDPKPGTVLTVSGWGVTQLGKNIQSDYLKATFVTVRSRDECRQPYEGFVSKITNEMICVQSTTCNGDSGGPLVDYSSGKAVIIGIVSFSLNDNCGSDNVPEVYTRVSAYLDFINKYKS